MSAISTRTGFKAILNVSDKQNGLPPTMVEISKWLDSRGISFSTPISGQNEPVIIEVDLYDPNDPKPQESLNGSV